MPKVDRKELRRTIETLIRLPIAEKQLRSKLEALASSTEFSELTPLWGPELYRRDRIFWRPFILHHFSSFAGWRVIDWKGDVETRMEAWLESADAVHDIEMARRLYNWKLDAKFPGKAGHARWRDDLVERFRSAPSHHGRNQVLAQFSSWRTLNEPSAIALYEADPAAASPFILTHLERNWWGAESRTLWERLSQKAHAAGDEKLYFELYRRQVSLSRWKKDVLELADSIADSDALNAQLLKRHLEGWDLDFGDGFEQLLKKRGRDVFPYILPRAGALARGWRTRSSVKDLVALAEEREWLDLWATLIRTAVDQSTFEREVVKLVGNRSLPESEVRRRLVMLTGASSEWNFGPFSFARVMMLGDDAALKLYERFPDLVRGPFKMNIGMTWSSDNLLLTERAIALGDEPLIDYLASRVAMTVPSMGKGSRVADLLAGYYVQLLPQPLEFAIRAAAALTQIPAFAVWNYEGLLKANRLARILFERTEDLFLHDPRSVRDLLESSQIHVQALAFRILGGNESRARELAAQNTDLLQATLFRPLHRRTRLMAFRAIENAASTAETARFLVERIREAFFLPETRYPREELIGVLASILKRWPELRGEREQPVVYGVAS